MKRAVLASAVVVLGLSGAAVAFAQQGPGRGMGWDQEREAGPGLMMPFMGGPGVLCSSPDAALAGGLAFAEKRLAITDAQKPAWNKLADALRASEPAIKTACDTITAHRQAEKPVALPDRLADMQKMMALGQEQLSRIQPLVADLYTKLTPEQKEIADQIGHHRHPRFGGPDRDHRGMMGWGGPVAPSPAK